MEGFSIRPWLVSLLIVGVVFAISRISRRMAKVHGGEPVGIGGWLILPIIGFIATIILTGAELSGVFFGWPVVVAVFSNADASLVGVKASAIMAFVAGVFVVFSAFACLFLIFSRNRSIVIVSTCHYVVLAVAGFVDFWGYTSIRAAFPHIPADPSAPTLVQAVYKALIAAIWIAYFHRSKRVRNTFVDPAMAISKAGAGTGTASLTP